MRISNRGGIYWLKGAALGVAVLYSLAFIWGAVQRYLVWQSAGRTVEWATADDPRALITLCFVLAVITLWQLEYVGKLVASMLFTAVIFRFVYWAVWTWKIKANSGLDGGIPAGGLIGNVWIGAGPLDLLALVAAGVLLVANVLIVWRHRGDLARQWRDSLSHS
jgi:hypothetical protein